MVNSSAYCAGPNATKHIHACLISTSDVSQCVLVSTVVSTSQCSKREANRSAQTIAFELATIRGACEGSM